MPEILQYDFMIRAFQAGIVIAIIAPLIGTFLVLRRYSLIADTLSHVSLAGVAIGLMMGVSPLLTALAASIGSSIAIERLRLSKRVFGESALSLFLSGSLALAVLLISATRGIGADLFSFLFGSITTVQSGDVLLIGGVGALVSAVVILLYKELVYVTVDEDAAKVSGIPTQWLNTIFIVLSACTVALAIPIVGVLLISALMVIPVITALQFRLSFVHTIWGAICLSIISVIVGIIASFYLNLATGGTIVLVNVVLFLVALLYNRIR